MTSKSTLFIDTETTGKADLRSDPAADHQPRIVQLAAILCDSGKKEVASLNLVIKPRVDIPEEASAIHGITNVYAQTYGVLAFHSLYILGGLLRRCDLVVGHNIEFDWFMLRGEFERENTTLPLKPTFCTMKAMTPICRIPGRYEDFKWPRLNEAYRHAFTRDFDGAHDALADVRACKEVYFWLQDRGAQIPTP